jgi:hypothetical protein
LKPVSNLINNTNNSGNNSYKDNAILLSKPQEQYLGDLDANSPLPFSIPIDLNANAIPEKYSFTLNVTYSDDLRQVHHAVLNGTADVDLLKESESESESESIIDVITKNYIMLIIVIAIIVLTIIGIFYAKRRKKSSSFKFGIGKENDEMKSKDNSLFENTSTLFDTEKDNEK